jgi:outer membrane protein, multidrug efflux system
MRPKERFMRNEKRAMALKKPARVLLVAAVASVLAACAVGPDYHKPVVAPSAEFIKVETQQFTANDMETDFWKTFSDPLLNDLIETALRANHDIRIAQSRLAEARALRGETRLDLAPTVTTSGGYTESKLSQRQQPFPGIDRKQDYYDASFDASWELDLFGRVRRGIESQNAQVNASIAGLENAQVSVTAEVARSYFELRGAQHQLDVARRNTENQRSTLELTNARLDAGRGTELDTSRAQSQLSATLATIPDLESAVTRSILRLGVLTGRSPDALLPTLSETRPLPALPTTTSIGTPEALLRRRPDIRVAENQLAAATAQVGVAVGDLFPRISLVGSWGFDAVNSGDLGNGSSETYSFGPSIRWAAFDLGRVRPRIKQRQAATDGALARYEQTVLRALEETDASMTDYVKSLAKQEHLRRSASASANAAMLARARFDNGAADFLTVLDAERTMLEAEDRLARSETQTATSLLAMYKALGGGFRPVATQASAVTTTR